MGQALQIGTAAKQTGLSIDTIWEKLCQGMSGIGKITRFDTHEYSAQIAGEVRDFTPEHYIDKRDLRRMDRFVHYAMAASQEAIQDAGLSITESMADRVVEILDATIDDERDRNALLHRADRVPIGCAGIELAAGAAMHCDHFDAGRFSAARQIRRIEAIGVPAEPFVVK